MKTKYSFGFFAALLFVWYFSTSSTQLQSKQAGTTGWEVPAMANAFVNPFGADPKAAEEGKKIYEATCWTCHGLEGKGDGPAAATLNPKPADHTSPVFQQQTDGAIFWKITTGRGQMAPFGESLSKQQRWKLVSYIRTLVK